jgi:hypothetical protein
MLNMRNLSDPALNYMAKEHDQHIHHWSLDVVQAVREEIVLRMEKALLY